MKGSKSVEKMLNKMLMELATAVLKDDLLLQSVTRKKTRPRKIKRPEKTIDIDHEVVSTQLKS